MSVGRKTGSKPLAFITSLMVLFALVVPFVGVAGANHNQAAGVERIDAGPDDSAPANTCNAFTVTAFGDPNDNTPAEGETVDIRATQQDGDLAQDLRIGFCDPDGTGQGSDLSGPQPDPASGQQTGGGGAAVADCDDDGNVENNSAAACNGGAGTGESPASIHDECTVDANGQCTFGIISNEAGTMTVTVFGDDDNNDALDTNEPRDVVTKTWTAGAGTARNITCSPATDNNPEGTRHEFQCTVTDANGQAVSGATVQFDVTAGPNSQEVGQSTCGPTNSSGQTVAPATENPPGSGQDQAAPTANACGYNDNIAGAANSPPGTDTITAFVNLGAQPGQPAPTNGLDAGEPSTTIQKTWVGQERTIDCEPETATNQVGTSHTVTCTVRDASGLPVQGARVDFTETGPATPDSNNANPAPGAGQPGGTATDANGQATFTIQTRLDDAAGTSTVRGSIANSAGTECTQAAGTPAGAPAGVCFDDVTKTWTRQGAPQCNDGVDNDADGQIDFPNDPGCADINDNTESPDPAQEPIRSASNITIRYDGNANAFKGAVGASRKRCQRGRTVILKKVRPGPNRTVGRDTTNRFGNWRITKNRVRGRYYATVLKLRTTTRNGAPLVCLRDRSVTIKLARGQS